MSSNEYEIATAEIGDDVYVAVQDGEMTHVYDPDGEKTITFYNNTGKGINELTLRLIVAAYRRGLRHGIDTGKTTARLEIRRALGVD